MSKDAMKKANESTTRIVRRDYDPSQRLTPAQLKQLAALDKLPDDQIDTSDAPELPEIRWRTESVRGKFYRPVKQPVTMRLDADVIAWLKAKAGPDGKGYQTTANQLLRSTMAAELRANGNSRDQEKVAR